MLRRRRPPEPSPPADPLAALDLAVIPSRHVDLVRKAVAAHAQWQGIETRVAPGPLADRLALLGQQVRAGVLEIHATARRVGEVEGLIADLDPEAATAAFKQAKRAAASGQVPPEMDALEARFESLQRMLNLVADADEQLRVLDARLLAAVARGAEVAVTADGGLLTSLGSDLDDVVTELGVLRRALTSFDSPS